MCHTKRAWCSSEKPYTRKPQIWWHEEEQFHVEHQSRVCIYVILTKEILMQTCTEMWIISTSLQFYQTVFQVRVCSRTECSQLNEKKKIKELPWRNSTKMKLQHWYYDWNKQSALSPHQRLCRQSYLCTEYNRHCDHQSARCSTVTPWQRHAGAGTMIVNKGLIHNMFQSVSAGKAMFDKVCIAQSCWPVSSTW